MMQATNLTAAAAVRLSIYYSFFDEVFYSMTVLEATPEQIAAGLETQATDGRSMWINRVFFLSIKLEQQVAEIVHELLHKILLHPTRRGRRDPQLWNVACDYAVNAIMYLNGFKIPSDWLLDMQYSGMLAETIYEKLLADQKKNPQQPLPQLAPGRYDVKEPQQDGKPLSPEQVEQFEEQIKTLVERAAANAQAMGSMPKGILQGLTKAYRATAEPWYNHLHRYMQSISTASYNWARFNRRVLLTHGVFAPSQMAEALGEVALFIDTSGSCFAKAQQAQFATHLNAILAEAKPRCVHVYYFDARVYPGEVIEAGELDIVTRPQGGGGTRFEPLFAQLEDEGITPEVAIVLTDLEGSFPDEEPAYPVVWANVLAWGEAPFGETIHLND
jgi:predicted metal-dependent peptidase